MSNPSGGRPHRASKNIPEHPTVLRSQMSTGKTRTHREIQNSERKLELKIKTYEQKKRKKKKDTTRSDL